MASRPVLVDPRDREPLLLRMLCDRGAQVQPENLIVNKTSKGYTTMTYKDHQAKVYRLASALNRWGVRIGDVLGTLLWNTPAHLQCYHAVSCMGAIVHTLNARLGEKDLSYIISHGNDRVIFVDPDLLELLSKIDQPVLDRVELFVCCGADEVPGAWKLPPGLPASKAIDYDALLATGNEAPYAWPDIPETSLHMLCYTSGTTGFPKGAAYSHRSTYLHTITTHGVDQLGIRGTDVVLPFVPMFHVLSWGVPYVSLMLGSRLVFTGKFTDADLLLNTILDWGVTYCTGVPTVWQGVRTAMEKRGLEKIKQACKLRTLEFGGSVPPLELLRWLNLELGADVINGWGMTEVNPLGLLGKSVARLRDVEKTLDGRCANIGKAGLPIPGFLYRIVDPANLDKELPRGQAGELLVRGPWVIGTYYAVDAKDKFHNGWLITGDVAKVDEEGAVIICDRSKDVIKSGGEWISSVDMENHVVALPEVALAAVVGVPHPRWDERPVVVVTLAANASAQGLKDKVVKHCQQIFAKFQLPDDVIVWEQMPLTSTGKLDKKVIREKLKQQGYVLPSMRKAPSKL